MVHLFARLIISAFALLVAAYLIPGIVVDDFYTALIVAVILGVCNVLVRPLLIILTLPITLLTLGLFLFVINAGIFWFVASFVEGFGVAGFIPALLGSLMVSVFGIVAGKMLE